MCSRILFGMMGGGRRDMELQFLAHDCRVEGKLGVCEGGD